MSNVRSPYLFTICQAGAEAVLKRELGRAHPKLKFAFSRPGFVTFKSPVPVVDNVELHSVFARAYGLSFGKLGSVAEPTALLQRLQELLPEAEGPFVLQVFAREDDPAPMEAALHDPERAQATAVLVESVRTALKAACPRLWAPEAEPRRGQGVVDVLLLEPNEAANSPLYLGFHRHGFGHTGWPGGRPPLVLPAEAPSRSYLKLEEALLRGHVPIRSGDLALEVGCAPGGAAYALLQRGLNVCGVDAAVCAPIVANSKRFIAIRKSISLVEPRELPRVVHWLLFDINAGSSRSIPEAKRLVEYYRSSLLGLVLTLKLADWHKADEIPRVLEQLRHWGFEHVVARHLYHNRQEVSVLGLMPKAQGRTPKGS